MEGDGKEQQDSSADRGRPGIPVWMALAMMMAILAAVVTLIWALKPAERSQIPYEFFINQIQDGNVQVVTLTDNDALGAFVEPPSAPQKFDTSGAPIAPDTDKPDLLHKLFNVKLPTDPQSKNDLRQLLERKKVVYSYERASDPAMIWSFVLSLVLLGAVIAAWFSMRRMQNQLMGGGFLSGFSRSPAKRYEGSKQAVSFKDVAGLEGVKADLLEIVDFLKNPQKFQKLGGRVPKGVLLNGPPGTGKTLLARAVAGEAGVPFFSVSGSEFIQMFVGVGASRVRDLFLTAKENAPAIIFIDEIDAVGRQRGAGLGGGHDEREQTLNQILSEMDGFTQTDTVIVLAATNRPDVLDPALLRPGRFDRHVTVDRPTLKGRLEIFKVHVRDVPLDDDVRLDRLAAGTVGLTGADIRNIVNEAALWAARNGKTRVSSDDFEYARDKVLIGPKREELLTEADKLRTAYHEAGHTILAWVLPGNARVHKVTIIPRGRTLGVTHTLPNEERLTMSTKEMRNRLCMLLGGRAAEMLVYQESDAGAENDLERATSIARRMVAHWGMSERLGPVSYKLSDEDPFLGREIHQQRQFSEHTMELIDSEITRVLHEADNRARTILLEKREQLDELARQLLQREELDEPDLEKILGPCAVDLPSVNGQGASGVAGAAGLLPAAS